MDVTFPAGALTADQRTELADELTTVLLRAERAPDTDFFREVTWIFMHELPEGAVLTAGRPVEKPIFKIICTTPEGALSARRRGELVAEATRVVREVAGIPEEDAMRIFVLCREIDEGSWGAGGHVIQFEQLRAIAAEQREKSDAAAPA